MDYCQETVIIQSAFLLAEKMVNLEQDLQKDDFFAVVKIIKESIREISEGLSVDKTKNTVLPIEMYALHRKIHLWFYKTWCNCRSFSSDVACFLERFPALPRIGTGFYVLIVKEMGWELLLAECLLETDEDALPFLLQDIVSATISFQEISFFTTLFDCLLPSFGSKRDCHINCNTSAQVLLEGLASLCEHITDKNQQLLMIKRIINLVFEDFQCLMKEHLERKTFVGSGEECKSDSVVCSADDDCTEHEDGTSSDDSGLTYWSHTSSQISNCLEVLMNLFTEQWKDTCNWKADNKDNIEQMDSSLWHPLHQWILKMYAVLGFLIDTSNLNTSQDSRMRLFYHGLTAYIEANAATCEVDWMVNQQKGLMIDCSGLNNLEDEHIDVSGIGKTLIFTHGSLKEQLDDSIWRINNNLEGSLDSLNWLLTTEELFDNPAWLKCIKDNVVKMGHKDQAIMMVDVLCVQRQIIESTPECNGNGFNIIKKLVIDIFNGLPISDQEELVKYAFSMSLLSDLDITSDSVFFYPTQVEEDKKKLQDDLQVLFNKLVDSSSVSLFKKQMKSIKELALLSPYLTVSKAVQVGVQYGQTATIVKILQEIPVLCSSDTATPLLCEILASTTTRLPNKQEENNLMKLVQMLLQKYRNANLPGISQALLEKSSLFSTCVLPHLNLRGYEKLMSTKIALKFLKTTISSIDSKNPTERSFVLRYLIPIVLALCRLLSDCKALWEEMGSNEIAVLDVLDLRSLVLTNLEESIDVIHSVFQSTPTGLIHPLEWLHNKLLSLGWTAALYIKPLLELLPTNHQYYIPKCVIEFCDLPTQHWSPCGNRESEYNVIDCLFDCCATSDTISSQIVNALEKVRWSSVDSSLKDQMIRTLSQVMTYVTWSEMRRIVSLCMNLIQKAQLPIEAVSFPHRTPLSSLPDLPANFTGVLIMSSILHQVFKLLLNSNTGILGNVIKLYVSTIKQMCQEFLPDSGLDKCLSGDVIAHVFDDLCHVICMVPLEGTDPLFILALDVASMVSGRHSVSLKQSVAMVPRSVYTESLLQKLEMKMLVQ